MSTIRTLIIEDEAPAAKRIERLLIAADPNLLIEGVLESVSSAVKWLQSHPHPHLMILDIHLADGLSFEIFKQVNVESFVIFTTAYDQYAIKAFELNSIDYLLKPIAADKLEVAINKFKKLKTENPTLDVNTLIKSLQLSGDNYKKRFVVNAGAKLKSLETDEVAFFYSMEKNTFLCTNSNVHYAINYSLDKLESLVDNEHFYRVNRQYLVNYKAIDKIAVLSGSRLKVEILPKTNDDVLVSTSRTAEFRGWLDR